MSLRYCKKCYAIFNEEESCAKGSQYFCLTCDSVLLYFGSESVSLSSDDVFFQYDLTHDANPVKAYTGYYYTDLSKQADSLSFIECEDVLKHDATNKEAMLYLGNYYLSVSDYKQSKYYFERYLESNSLSESLAKRYCDVLFALDEHQLVVGFLKTTTSFYSKFFIKHTLAVARLGLNQYKKALKYFYEAYMLCENSKKKTRIQAMISSITAYLEEQEKS